MVNEVDRLGLVEFENDAALEFGGRIIEMDDGAFDALEAVDTPDQVGRLDDVFAAPPLGAHLHDAVMAFGGFEHRAAQGPTSHTTSSKRKMEPVSE